MWVRKRLDIGWSDLAVGIARACLPGRRAVLEGRLEQCWSSPGGALACLSVRSGFDLLLDALSLPAGSEILMSAVTVADMTRIARHHGLVPVPVDLNVGRLTPDIELMRRAITAKTRAVVVAHLFGGRAVLGPVVELARRHGLLVIEDGAQAFTGVHGGGDPDADVSMFSFGPIKTATSLGGAVLLVREHALLTRMRTRQARWPVQRRGVYLGRLTKYAALKVGSARPVLHLLVRGCEALGLDCDRLFNGLVRGFAGPRFFARIRRQPSAPLLASMQRRLRTFDRSRLAARTAKGRLLAELLGPDVPRGGEEMIDHTYWVFPILVHEPDRMVTLLRQAGFDATRGTRLAVIAPPADRPELAPVAARAMLAHVVFLPLYPEMPDAALRKMARVVLGLIGQRNDQVEPCGEDPYSTSRRPLGLGR